MGCRGLAALALAALAYFAMVGEGANIDTATSKKMEEVIKGDNLVLSLNNIKPRKRSRDIPESLFAVDFPNSNQKFAILLDRSHSRVTVETMEDGRLRHQHFIVDTLEKDSHIKSLILSVNQKQPGADVTLYIDCTSYGMVATPRTMRDMFEKMKNPELQVYHEKKYPIEVDAEDTLRKVLIRNNCPVPKQPEDEALEKFFQEHKNHKKNSDLLLLEGDPDVQGMQPEQHSTVRRGDIPLVSNFNEDTLLDALNKLIVAVNHLTHTTQHHTTIIERLQRLIEECELCRRPQPQVATCATHPPGCAAGVRCHDTADGPRCGHCPRGYIGDGYTCRPGRTCADRPCFQGVQCTDTEQGARCGSCPPGYEGNGEQCTRVNMCQYNPCHQGCSTRCLNN